MRLEDGRQRYLDAAKARFDRVLALQKAGLVCKDGDFVPSVHYPPITQYDAGDERTILEGFALAPDGCTDIYVHIPFCIQHCVFCHYPGKVGPQLAEKDRYLGYLEREMDLWLNRLGIQKFKPRSILIGGGTPTFLAPAQLERLMRILGERMDTSALKQYNWDVDPNSLVGAEGEKRLEILKKYGADRLTIGVQSLDDGVLRVMNRAHTAQMAIEAIRNTQAMGFQLNIEFIYGHPGETIENWIPVIEQAITLNTDEIQLYRLKVLAYGDKQGRIIQMRDGSSHAIPDFQTTMYMKDIALSILRENGYHENLRRVYSKQRKIFSHYAYNQCCNQYDQLGFGTTGFSSLRDRFTINPMDFEEYYAKIDRGVLPVNRGYIRSADDQLRWAIVLPLKNRSVIKRDFERIAQVPFDKVFRAKVNRLIDAGLLEDDGREVKLTEMGAFLADEVVEQFNASKYLPFPRDAYEDGPLNPYNDNEAFSR